MKASKLLQYYFIFWLGYLPLILVFVLLTGLGLVGFLGIVGIGALGLLTFLIIGFLFIKHKKSMLPEQTLPPEDLIGFRETFREVQP